MEEADVQGKKTPHVEHTPEMGPVSECPRDDGCPKADASFSLIPKHFDWNRSTLPYTQSLATIHCSVQLWHTQCMYTVTGQP
jgi:hypothetical protein